MTAPAPRPADDPAVATLRVVLAGLVALAVAMGIGRFAFTPLLPLMLRDGTLDAASGAEWAAANYAGYLLGALTAARFSRDPARGLRVALAGVALSTLAIAWDGVGATPLAGAAMRAAAGVFSAWTLVCASSWCLGELAQRRAPQLGAWIYTGVGVGISLAGVLAWLGGRQPAQWLWLELGLLAAAGSVAVARWQGAVAPGHASANRAGVGGGATGNGGAVSARSEGAALARGRGAAPTGGGGAARTGDGGHGALVLCYGTFGFGYIVPATFLPAMARAQVADPLVFGLTWPLFGLAAALSVAAAARWLSAWPRRRVWALAQGVMALGTALPLFAQALWALAASAVLVGGTFMVATMAGLQLARERTPANPTPLLGRMTVAFAAGQIAGPLLVRALALGGIEGAQALAWSNAFATALLAASAAWLRFGGREERGAASTTGR